MSKLRRPDVETKQRKWGDRKEAGMAKRPGYTKTSGSGSGAEKGDLRRGNWMLELKSTRAESFRVTAEIMAKLRNDGLTNGRPGALIVSLGDGNEYAVMPLRLFDELVDPDGN